MKEFCPLSLSGHKWVPLRKGYPQMLCRCGCMAVKSLKSGENTITTGPAGVGDVIRWSATKAAVALGDIGMDTASGRGQQFRSGATRGFLDELDLSSTIQPTETGEIIPLPEGRVGADSTNAIATTLSGASYFMRRQTTFNRIIFAVSNQTGAPTLSIQIFQTADGLSGTATRVATVTAFAIGAAGTFTATPTEGNVTLKEGLIYILYGRDSAAGTITLRMYSTQAIRLLTSTVETTTHPTTFTTTLAANVSQATFNPLQTAGGDASATATDVCLIARLRKA